MFTHFYVALVSFGKATAEHKAVAESFGVAIYSWDEFLQLVGYLLHKNNIFSSHICIYGSTCVNCYLVNTLVCKSFLREVE